MEESTADQLIDGALATFLTLFTWMCIQLMALIDRRVKSKRKWLNSKQAAKAASGEAGFSFKFKDLLWDRTSKTDMLGHNGYEDGVCIGRHSFDLYVNFLWIFAGIYALSKLTQLLELYLGQRLLSKKNCCEVRSMSREWEQTVQLYEQDKCQLEAQVHSWREKNLSLEQTIKELRDCNIHFISENFMRTVMQEQKTQPAPSNIYINNSHFHLTRQVFVNEGEMDVNVRTAGGDDLCEPGATKEGQNVWVQYLKMRKCYMGPIADPNLTAPNSAEQLQPIVMTTEQLAKLQGMI